MVHKALVLRQKLMVLVGKLSWLAPLSIRVTVGIAFIVTGWGKLHNLDKVIGFFDSLGIPYPSIQAPFVAGLEFFGGIAMILGFGARLFAVPMAFSMVVAIITAKKSDLTDWTDLFDFIEWHYAVFFFVIALLGAGPVSLDYLIAKKLTPPSSLPPPAADPRTPTSTSSSPPP